MNTTSPVFHSLADISKASRESEHPTLLSAENEIFLKLQQAEKQAAGNSKRYTSSEVVKEILELTQR